MPDDAGTDAYDDADHDADDANHDADDANDAVTNGDRTAAVELNAAWTDDAGRSVSDRPLDRRRKNS